MTKEKPETNPIEKAIGDRAKTPEPTPTPSSRPNLDEVGEVSPTEMLSLEELNRRTEEKLQDQYLEEPQAGTIVQDSVTTPQESITIPQETTTIPVSKPAPQPATKTSTPESPPQETEPDNHEKHVEAFEAHDKAVKKLGTPQIENDIPAMPDTLLEKIDIGVMPPKPVEEKELTALKKYILEDGFVLSTVAFHVVTLCAEPMTTPSTTTWDFAERSEIPAMVFALLNQPGYLEGIWPSLRIVMGSNKGNAAWTAGIATTIAFFDVIRTLPALEELKNAN